MSWSTKSFLCQISNVLKLANVSNFHCLYFSLNLFLWLHIHCKYIVQIRFLIKQTMENWLSDWVLSNYMYLENRQRKLDWTRDLFQMDFIIQLTSELLCLKIECVWWNSFFLGFLRFFDWQDSIVLQCQSFWIFDNCCL